MEIELSMVFRRAIGRLLLWFIDPVQDERVRPMIEQIKTARALFGNV
jgi:hypothetical protein